MMKHNRSLQKNNVQSGYSLIKWIRRNIIIDFLGKEPAKTKLVQSVPEQLPDFFYPSASQILDAGEIIFCLTVRWPTWYHYGKSTPVAPMNENIDPITCTELSQEAIDLREKSLNHSALQRGDFKGVFMQYFEAAVKY
jgi:hypothetical protein